MEKFSQSNPMAKKTMVREEAVKILNMEGKELNVDDIMMVNIDFSIF